ncbi:hypothetical protein SAMN06295945_0901 [Polynucleobacter meluiroseus]|uniref:Uncharacterized protein n=1 Tax=Polynucleobacter meluiroseus TaxID=1938814 RepID=A0A240DZD9_9BURK|nr:ankyrin repeat domain-containing protein [Polynucleobacter meluiroseus]SNX28569.1 hypothetical protein SAMN06295945_0901 [Polynucleobacter meluiroseus]
MIFNFKYKQLLLSTLWCFSGGLLAQTADQVTDFTRAAKFDDVSEVKSLISQGVNPNTKDPKGNPMLLIAVREKSFKVIDLLVANPATNVNLPNSSNETPLMMASIDGDLSLVKELVSKGADINRLGWTPLQYASTTGRLEIAQFLVVNGAKVNALSPSNTTSLMMAAQSGNDQLVKYLLDSGADLKLRNTAGFSAIDVAALFDKEGIKEGLMSRWQKLFKETYPGGPLKNP